MPQSPPEHPNQESPRFSVGVTRVCLSSGTLQIPFAMRGVLNPGTYQTRDTELDQLHELTFEPPRSLRGLEAVFAAHDLHPNDQVILTVTGDGLELEVAKRPRRKSPQMKGEPWESVSGARAAPSGKADPARREDAPRWSSDRSSELSRAEAPTTFESPGRRASDAALEAGTYEDEENGPHIVRARRVTPQRRGADSPEEASGRRPQGPAGRRDAEPGGPPSLRPSAARRFYEDPGDPADPYDPEAPHEGAWGWEHEPHDPRQDSRGPIPSYESRRPPPEDETADGSRSVSDFLSRIAQAAKGALSFRSADRPQDIRREVSRHDPYDDEDPYADFTDEAAGELDPESVHRSEAMREAAYEEQAYRSAPQQRAEAYGDEFLDPEPEAPHRAGSQPPAASHRQPAPRTPTPQRGADARGPVEPQRLFDRRSESESAPERDSERSRSRDEPPPQGAAEGARRLEPRGQPPQRSPMAPPAGRAEPRRDVVVEDADADAMDRQGPPMFDVGEGDLRQRLIRFLQHPDVPVILRTDMVARNFGLGMEVADAMLEDLANDKIDGLAVTKVRDETYRVSRAPTRL